MHPKRGQHRHAAHASKDCKANIFNRSCRWNWEEKKNRAQNERENGNSAFFFCHNSFIIIERPLFPANMSRSDQGRFLNKKHSICGKSSLTDSTWFSETHGIGGLAIDLKRWSSLLHSWLALTFSPTNTQKIATAPTLTSITISKLQKSQQVRIVNHHLLSRKKFFTSLLFACIVMLWCQVRFMSRIEACWLSGLVIVGPLRMCCSTQKRPHQVKGEMPRLTGKNVINAF